MVVKAETRLFAFIPIPRLGREITIYDEPITAQSTQLDYKDVRYRPNPILVLGIDDEKIAIPQKNNQESPKYYTGEDINALGLTVRGESRRVKSRVLQVITSENIVYRNGTGKKKVK